MADPAVAEISRIYRRMCILRATGRDAEADRIQSDEYASAVAALQADQSSGEDTDARIRMVENAEESRAADAVVLAELLAPLMAQKLQRHEREPLEVRKERAIPVAEPRSTRPPSSGGIADFIDQMLQQESAH